MGEIIGPRSRPRSNGRCKKAKTLLILMEFLQSINTAVALYKRIKLDKKKSTKCLKAKVKILSLICF